MNSSCKFCGRPYFPGHACPREDAPQATPNEREPEPARAERRTELHALLERVVEVRRTPHHPNVVGVAMDCLRMFEQVATELFNRRNEQTLSMCPNCAPAATGRHTHDCRALREF